MSDTTALGDNIHRLRKARKWSQAHLAEEVGLTKSAISSFELGKASPSRATEKKLSLVFGESLSEPARVLTHPQSPPAYLVVVARSERECNERVHQLLGQGYRLRGPLHVATDGQGLLLVQDLAR